MRLGAARREESKNGLKTHFHDWLKAESYDQDKTPDATQCEEQSRIDPISEEEVADRRQNEILSGNGNLLVPLAERELLFSRGRQSSRGSDAV